MSDKPLAGFSIRFQKGITGGFAPPIPTELHTLVVDADASVLTLTSRVRPRGTPELGAPSSRTLTVDDDITESLQRLKSILGEIPPQYPGAADLYRQDISIIALPSHGEARAMSDVPYGSVAAAGVPTPTSEQQVEFLEAVAIVRKLVAEPAQS